MIRTQIRVTEEQGQALREQAAQENVSVAELVRRAIDAFIRSDSLAFGATGSCPQGCRAVRFGKERYLNPSRRGVGGSVPFFMIFVDTSALYAVLDRSDANHTAAKAQWSGLLQGNDLLLVSNY